MPRTSRTVAQRLAAQGKSRKRRFQRTGASVETAGAVTTVPTAPVADDAVTEERVAPPPPRPSSPVTVRRTASAGTSPRASAPRRPYAAYADEYRYVWSDLKQIMLISGVLLVLLIVLWLFIH